MFNWTDIAHCNMLVRAGLTLCSTLVAGFAVEVLNVGNLTRLRASYVVGFVWRGR